MRTIFSTVLLCTLSITATSSYNDQLANAHGFELINDIGGHFHKRGLGEDFDVTLSQMQFTITQQGFNETKETLRDIFTQYYQNDPDTGLTKLATVLHEELSSLSCLFQQIAMYCTMSPDISSDQSKQQEIINKLLPLQATIKELQNSIPAPAEYQEVMQIAIATHNILDTCRTVIDNHFTYIPETYTQIDCSEKDPSNANICTTVLYNAHDITALEDEIHHMHLKWYNKAYRTTFDTCTTYPKTVIATLAAISLATGGALKYSDIRTLEKINPESPLYYLRKVLWNLRKGLRKWADAEYDPEVDAEYDPNNNETLFNTGKNFFEKCSLKPIKQLLFGPYYDPEDTTTKEIQNIIKQAQENPEMWNDGYRYQQEINHAHTAAQNNKTNPGYEFEHEYMQEYDLGRFVKNHFYSLLTYAGSTTATFELLGNIAKLNHYGSNIRDWLLNKLISMHNQLYHNSIFDIYGDKYRGDIDLEDKRFDTMRDQFEPFYRILDYIENPEKYIHGGLSVPKSILITGPSGCGKTFAAAAFGKSLEERLQMKGDNKQAFIPVDLSWWFSFGTENATQEIINLATQNAPCILYIDEIHTFQAQKNTNSKMLFELLTELDKLDLNRDPRQQIFIVASTNQPQYLADELTRDGRFGTRIAMTQPGYEQRKDILQARCESAAINSDHLDFDYLASITSGVPLSSLEKTFEHATFLARRDNQPVNMVHFYKALNAVVRKINPVCTLSDEEKDSIAAYYASQTLVTYTSDDELLDAVTICPINTRIKERNIIWDNSDQDESEVMQSHTHYGSVFTRNTYEQFKQTSKKVRRNRCKQLIAGKIGEEIITGIQSSFQDQAVTNAYQEALAIVCDGIPLKELSEHKQNEKRDEALALFNAIKEEVRSEINNNQDTITQLKDALLQEYFLHRTAIDQIIGNTTTQAAIV